MVAARPRTGVDEKRLLGGKPAGPPVPRGGTLLGSLFESLVTRGVRVFAQADAEGGDELLIPHSPALRSV